MVVGSVKSEEELLKLKLKLDIRGIKAVVFIEPDRGNEATALATEPLCTQDRKILSSLKLWSVD